MIHIETTHTVPHQVLIRGRLLSDSIFSAARTCAGIGRTGETNKNDKVVCWQGLRETGTRNSVGGTINWKKKILKSNFAIVTSHENYPPLWPARASWGKKCPKEEFQGNKHICKKMCRDLLYIKMNHWKQPKYPTVRKWFRQTVPSL